MLLHFNSKYGVLLCSDHGYAVRCLNTHLRDSHKLSSKERNPILQQYQHHILVNPNDVTMPSHGISPIPYLTLCSGVDRAVPHSLGDHLYG